jgi:hypothetical protein
MRVAERREKEPGNRVQLGDDARRGATSTRSRRRGETDGKDPEVRYQSCTEFVEHIVRALR